MSFWSQFTADEHRSVALYRGVLESIPDEEFLTTEKPNLRSIAESAGINLRDYPKDGVVIQALWVFYMMRVKNVTPQTSLKYQTLESFLEAYPQFSSKPESELNNLWHSANWMVEFFKIIPAYKNKGLVMMVIPKLVEGWEAKYITGSGQKEVTSNRVALFECEGAVKPNCRGKQAWKSKPPAVPRLSQPTGVRRYNKKRLAKSWDDYDDDDKAAARPTRRRTPNRNYVTEEVSAAYASPFSPRPPVAVASAAPGALTPHHHHHSMSVHDCTSEEDGDSLSSDEEDAGAATLPHSRPPVGPWASQRAVKPVPRFAAPVTVPTAAPEIEIREEDDDDAVMYSSLFRDNSSTALQLSLSRANSSSWDFLNGGLIDFSGGRTPIDFSSAAFFPPASPRDFALAATTPGASASCPPAPISCAPYDPTVAAAVAAAFASTPVASTSEVAWAADGYGGRDL